MTQHHDETEPEARPVDPAPEDERPDGGDASDTHQDDDGHEPDTGASTSEDVDEQGEDSFPASDPPANF